MLLWFFCDGAIGALIQMCLVVRNIELYTKYMYRSSCFKIVVSACVCVRNSKLKKTLHMESLCDNVYMKLLVDLRNSGQVVTIHTGKVAHRERRVFLWQQQLGTYISLAYSTGDAPAPVVIVERKFHS